MKQIKILGVLAIALTLGLAACGKGNSGEAEHVHTFETAWSSNSTKHWHKATCEHKNEKGDEAPHTWGDPYDVQKPTCTEAGSQKLKCTVCEYVKTETLKALGHDAQPAADSSDWHLVRDATCTVDGVKTYHCSKCNQDVEVAIPAPGHKFIKDAEGNDVIKWETAPTCTEAGVGGYRECEVCHEHVEVESAEAAALGHEFVKDADGNDVVTWTKEATCTEAGVGTKHCTRCNQDIEYTVDALGHDIQLVDGEITPVEGKAAVRLYKCTRCDVTYMGFKANEPSTDSKSHLVIDEDGGARFWGRPIGNALALKADGSSQNEQNGEVVYCSTETGDFFEYKFDLTAAQAAELQNCRLYCDAKPANYLNGTDFWAYGANNDEWTPGYYIDGAEGHYEVGEDNQPVMVNDHARSVRAEDGSEAAGEELTTQVKMGKRIEDYRYILYVDGQVKDFDPEIKAPTHGSNQNMRREEFVLPYTFQLHEGENIISLRMAGGYRSTFYNFTFRPYEEPENPEHTHKYADAKAGTIETEGCTPVDVYHCVDGDASALRWEAKAYDATLSNAIEAAASDGSIRFDRAQGKNGEDDKGGHLVYKINSPVAAKDVNLDFYIQAHSQNVAIFDAVGNDSGAGKDVDADGKYTVTPTKRYALYVNDVRVELGDDPGASTAKAWFQFPCKFDLKAGENKIELVSLGGYRAKMYNFQLSGLPKVSIPVKTWSLEDIKAGRTDSGWSGDKDFGEAGKAFKFNKVGSFTVSYTAEKAEKVTLQLKIAVKQSNNAKTQFWRQIEGEAEGGVEKTRITFNGTAVTPGAEPDFTKSVASSVNDSGIISVPEWYSIIELDLVAGENTIKVEYLAGGFSYYIGGAQLVK